MRTTLLVIAVALIGCKDTPSAQQRVEAPRVSKFAPLPPAPTATLDASDGSAGSGAVFPKEQPVIAVWQGGGEIPRTLLSIRVWADGTVRFKCGRRGSIPADRVTAMLETFAKAGWTAPQPMGVKETNPNCTSTSVQIVHAGVTHRENADCGTDDTDEMDAVRFVQAVVGPDPCQG